jgi:hypothetical protein
MVLDCNKDISKRTSGSGRLPDDTTDIAIAEELDIAPFHSVLS